MNGFDYFKKVVTEHYADFDGRARRSEYWYFTLFSILIIITAMILDSVLGFPLFYFVAILGLLVPSIAVVVRRLHDTGRSGWWYLIGLVPLVGAIVLLVFYCQDSEPGMNQYGPNPKNPAVSGGDIIDHLVE